MADIPKPSSINSTETETETAIKLDKLATHLDNAENLVRSLGKVLAKHSLYIGQVCSSELKMTDHLLRDAGKLDNGSMFSIFSQWNSFAAQAKSQAEHYCLALQRTLVESLKKMGIELRQFKSRTKTRAYRANKLARLRRKYHKLHSCPRKASTLLKLGSMAQQIEQKQTELDDLSKSLMFDMSCFLSEGPTHLWQSVGCFVSAEIRWFQDCERSFEGRPSLTGAVDEKSTAHRAVEVECILKAMDSLSIVKHGQPTAIDSG